MNGTEFVDVIYAPYMPLFVTVPLTDEECQRRWYAKHSLAEQFSILRDQSYLKMAERRAELLETR